LDNSPSSANNPSDSTIDADELAHFERLSQDWWETDGPMSALIKLNPIRIGYIRDKVMENRRFGDRKDRPFDGLHILDIGCGGGLLSEPMTRLGAKVTGIDASNSNINVARTHASRMGLDIDYREESLKHIAASGEQYDIVLAMEVLEHVTDKLTFIRLASKSVKPEGVMFLSTINQTFKAFGMAIIGAEYILKWLPKGTHDWNKFTHPSLLTQSLLTNGLDTIDVTGVRYRLSSDRWALTTDLSVNYMVHAYKPKAGEHR